MEKVLVIDDEFDVLLLCRVNLSHAGLQVQEAKSGKAGLESALEDTPDAVVLDLMMPEMDGFEVLKRLRDDERTSAIPVVILSARTGEADRARCVALGANDYITKPFFPDELVDRLGGAHLGQTLVSRPPALVSPCRIGSRPLEGSAPRCRSRPPRRRGNVRGCRTSPQVDSGAR